MVKHVAKLSSFVKIVVKLSSLGIKILPTIISGKKCCQIVNNARKYSYLSSIVIVIKAKNVASHVVRIQNFQICKNPLIFILV